MNSKKNKFKLLKTKLINNHYIIDKNNISHELLNNIKKELFMIPIYIKQIMKNDDSFNIEQIGFPIYLETENTITVPRFYGIKNFGIPTQIEFNNNVSNFEFNGSLRNEQKVIMNIIINHLNKFGGGIVQAGCGSGKTILAICTASILKMKTLVLVHESFLQSQWVDRIKQFTNAKVGIIRQNKIADNDCDIVIAMVQSIQRRDYNNILDNFGFLIIDECHHYAASIFSKVFYKIGASKILGLSATPLRQDGLTCVIENFIGNIFYKQAFKINKNVTVKIFRFNSSDPLYVEKMGWNPFKKQLDPSHIKMISNFTITPSRNNHLINIINGLRKIPGRKILVLSERVKHLEILKNGIDDLLQKDINDGIILQDECKTYYYIGDSKEYERKEAEEKGDILFGTTHIAQEALDIPRLNTIVLATSKKNITQAIGRIMRKILETGDLKPLIIDFFDTISIFKNQGNQRQKIYNMGEYDVETYYLHDNKIINLREGLKRDFDMDDQQINSYINEYPNANYECNIDKILNLENIQEDMQNMVTQKNEKTVIYKKTDFSQFIFDDN